MTFWTEMMGQPFCVNEVDVKGVPTRALIAGTGEDVIFLHGISGHLEAFIPTIPYHAKHFRVHAIDMLGHGYTGKPGGMYGIDRYAQHVVDYMDASGIAQAHIVGISLGGWVTAWLLVNHAERVKRATMILAPGKMEADQPEVRARIRKSTADAVLSDDIEYTRKRLQNVVHNPEAVTQELVDTRYKIYHLPEFRAGIDDILDLTNTGNDEKYNMRPEWLSAVKTEVLLAWSEHDAYSTAQGAQYWVDNLPHQKLALFKDAGHWPPFECPAAFAEVNIAFLQGGLEAVQEGAH